jgi:hypothetical protein
MSPTRKEFLSIKKDFEKVVIYLIAIKDNNQTIIKYLNYTELLPLLEKCGFVVAKIPKLTKEGIDFINSVNEINYVVRITPFIKKLISDRQLNQQMTSFIFPILENDRYICYSENYYLQQITECFIFFGLVNEKKIENCCDSTINILPQGKRVLFKLKESQIPQDSIPKKPKKENYIKNTFMFIRRLPEICIIIFFLVIFVIICRISGVSEILTKSISLKFNPKRNKETIKESQLPETNIYINDSFNYYNKTDNKYLRITGFEQTKTTTDSGRLTPMKKE